MKKFFALLMILTMCLSLFACGEKSAVVGTWETDVAVVGENAIEGDHFSYMTFKNNGKCTYIYYVNEAEISRTDIDYTVTDTQITMSVEGREMVCDYVVEGDVMTLTYNGNTQTLIRVKEG